jgi:hypothetical protein
MELTSQESLEAEIIQGNVDNIVLDVTETQNTVKIMANGVEALYMPEEARGFADRMEELSREVWETTDNEQVIEFARDLADVVDGNVTKDEVKTDGTSDNREKKKRQSDRFTKERGTMTSGRSCS